MAIDIEWVSIPEHSELFLLAKNGKFSDDIEFISTAYEKKLSGDFKEFKSFVDLLLKERPNIASRRLNDINRTYATIAYLLSEEIQTGVKEPLLMTALASKIIYGSQSLFIETKSSIGIPIRYSNPEQVRKSYEFLAPLTQTDLFQSFNAQKMEYEVYKFGSATSPEFKQSIWEDFCKIRKLYEISSHIGDESILVIMK